MKKMVLALSLALVLCLSGCRAFVEGFVEGFNEGYSEALDEYSQSSDGGAEGSSEESSSESSRQEESESESRREILPDPDDDQRQGDAQDPADDDDNASVSLMAQLPAGASTDDMVRAFEKDYQRAARKLGVNTIHSNLEYEENDGTAMVTLENGMMIYLDPPSTYHRVWYVGYFDSDEWMLQEAQLALMACAPTIPADVAARYVDDFFVEAWNNRDNMPSAIIDRDSWDGLTCSLSLNDRGLVSYWILFDSPAAQGYEQI